MKSIVLNGLIPVNCYIINKNDQCFVIDPGSDINTLKQNLEGLKVIGVLLTHGHGDHTNEIGAFDCPIYMHKDDYILLTNKLLAGYQYLGCEPKYDIKKLNIKFISDKDTILFLNSKFTVIHTPGHTLGSVCYLYEDKLFSGDTLFHLSIGRTDLPNSSSQAMRKSLVTLIDQLDDNVKVYPGHDAQTTIKTERKENKYYLNYKKR